MFNLVDVFGVVTPSNNCCCLVPGESDATLDVPLGTCIARWDAHTGTRLFCNEAHHESVSAIARNREGTLTLSGSHNGEVTLWDSSFRKPAHTWSFPHSVITQLHTSQSDPSLFLAVDRSREQFNISGRDPRASLKVHPATFRVYRVHSNRDKEEQEQTVVSASSATSICPAPAPVAPNAGPTGTRTPLVSELWSLHAPLIWVRFVGNRVLVIDEREPEEHEKDIERTRGFSQFTHARFYDAESGQLLLDKTLAGVNITAIDVTDNYIALGKFDGSVSVLDSHTLEELWCHSVEKAGRVRAVAIARERGLVAYPSTRGRVVVADVRDGSVRDQVLTDSGGNVCMLSFSISEEHVWVTNEYSIMYYPVRTTAATTPKYASDVPVAVGRRVSRPLQSAARVTTSEGTPNIPHRMLVHNELSNCGVDIHPHGTFIATGDLGANVSVYPLVSAADSPGHYRVKAETSIRSVAWHPDGTHVFYGCFDGSIWKWKYDSPRPRPKKVLQLHGAVTCLRWRPDYLLLACGSVTGELAIYSDPAETVVTRHQAHASNMEVWSLQWSPDGMQIVTCSEDQTSCVWNVHFKSDHDVSIKKDRTLRGHTMAVTCTDWKLSENLGPLLITSSDDRTLRVYTTHDWKLYHVFQTQHLYVTYCALEEHGSRFICVTEDGYRYVFCLHQKKELDRRKIHHGSVEGLSWHGATGIVGCCSSDCTVHVSVAGVPQVL